MTQQNAASDEEDDLKVDLDSQSFEELVASGGVGKDINVAEGEVIGIADDGVEIRYLTDTRELVADVEGVGLDDFPGGEPI